MPKFHLTRTLPYDADKLCAMVGDVETYPQFIPWITELRAYNHERSGGFSRFDADVAVGFKILSEKFTTQVARDTASRVVDMTFLKGPFKKLEGQWRFTPIDGGTRIDFDMDVEIRNPILQHLFNANFERVSFRLMHVFEERAKQMFGMKV